MFLGSPRKDNAIVQLRYTSLSQEANSTLFHQILESIRIYCETHWHSKPLEGTKKNANSGISLAGGVHRYSNSADISIVAKKALAANVSKFLQDRIGQLDLIVCLLSWR